MPIVKWLELAGRHLLKFTYTRLNLAFSFAHSIFQKLDKWAFYSMFVIQKINCGEYPLCKSMMIFSVQLQIWRGEMLDNHGTIYHF